MATTNPVGVLIADHHGVRRLGLAAVIGREHDLKVVGEASTGSEAIERFRTHRPEVMLLDLGLPDAGGLAVIAAIRRDARRARIVVSTGREGEEAVYRAMRAGAAGSLRRDAPPSVVLEAIRTVGAGQPYLAPALATRLAARTRQDPVTSGEVGVLRLVASGLCNRRIGERLQITESAVKARLASARVKLCARDRAHAVTMAFAHNLIDLDDVDTGQPRP